MDAVTLDRYSIRLPELSDDLILQTDEAGSELIHYAVNIAGKWLRVRYPRFGQWDDYCLEVHNLLRTFATDIQDFKLPDDLEKRAENWAYLLSLLIQQRGVTKEIERIAKTYLRPMLDELDVEQSWAWIRENAPIDLPIRLLCAVLEPFNAVKKNGGLILQRVFKRSIGLHSSNTSTPSSAGVNQNSINVPFSQQVSF